MGAFCRVGGCVRPVQRFWAYCEAHPDSYSCLHLCYCNEHEEDQMLGWHLGTDWFNRAQYEEIPREVFLQDGHAKCPKWFKTLRQQREADAI